MLGGHKSYKEIQSRKRNSQSGMSKGTGWDLIFSMVLRGDLLEKVTFTRDLKLGRTGTTWISWGAPRGTASTGPLLYPPPLLQASGVLCLLCFLCLSLLCSVNIRIHVVRVLCQEGHLGWRRWTVLVGSCQRSEKLLHLIFTVIPERKTMTSFYTGRNWGSHAN